MKNRAKTFLLVLGIVVIGGCSSQGKSIMTTFQSDDTPPETLQEKMKWLEPTIAEGKTDEQFRIVRTLRYNTKYNNNIEKRKLAVKGLIFSTAFSTDSDVRSSALSRLITILNNPQEDFSLRQVVVDGMKDLVLGTGYYEERNPSLFSNNMKIDQVYPEEEYREEALMFLITHFEDMEADMQRHIITAFGQILGNQPVCIEKDEDGCDETDKEIQDELKKTLGKQINYWSRNNCEWDQDTITPDIKKALIKMGADYPNLIAENNPVCALFNPGMEDYSVLEMSSIKIPHNYWQFGMDITDTPSSGVHASKLEFGFGNGETLGIIFGMNIDEAWMEPIREKYFTLKYRPTGSNTAIGITRTLRTPDFSRNDSNADDVDGAVEDESKFVYGTDENELFITAVKELNSIDSHLHLHLGTINQKIALQYFFRKPDISFILEGTARTEMTVKDRETDTIANQDLSERESQANAMENDILLGAKWNNISLLKPLFIGRTNREGRQGIFDFKLYYSPKREKTYFVVTSPF